MRKFAKKISSSRPKGITSILVVIAVAVILTTIIGGIAALTVREIRQASNTERSSRALQTAESGVKAMAQKLNTEPTYEKTDCDPTAFSDILSDPNQQITCITSTSKFTGSYESFLDKDNATQVFLGEAYTATIPDSNNTPVYLKVSWNNKNLDNPAISTYPPNSSLYPVSAGYNFPAAMEISVISWPSTGISGSNSEVGTIFLMPGRDDASAAFGLTGRPIAGQVKSTCNPSNDYTCSTNDTTAGKVGFNIFAALGKTYNSTTPSSNPKFALRIKPRYANTHFKIEAYNAGGTAVNIQSSKAQIDVTAKVGELYRRVKAEKLVLPSSVENVFDSVLFAGNNLTGSGDTASAGICKNLITKNPTGTSYEQVKDNSCTP
ncbi:MAG: hypothetical protein WCP56_02565 [Candidatus Saccharibacteria bacterium]